MKIWVEKAPIFGVSTNEEVLNFIKKYSTCSIPCFVRNEDTDFLMNFTSYKKAFDGCTKSENNIVRLLLICFFFEKMEKVLMKKY
jgi:hypothetical protein